MKTFKQKWSRKFTKENILLTREKWPAGIAVQDTVRRYSERVIYALRPSYIPKADQKL